MALPAAQALHSYCAGISHGPVSVPILNAWDGVAGDAKYRVSTLSHPVETRYFASFNSMPIDLFVRQPRLKQCGYA